MIMKDSSCSYFHPKEGVGVCPLCLNERLLILASTTSSDTHRFVQPVSHIKSPKFFAFTSLLNRLQFKHSKSQTSYDPDDAASTPQADSFISIKFEEDGVGSWETGEVTKVSLEHCTKSWNPTTTQNQREANKSVVEQVKPRGLLRWQKRIGHLFQLIKSGRGPASQKCATLAAR
ncbi:uncharacterized protein LOC105770906 [Gossypium raimondii]|uniref:Uncharacterized protein n=1 Tax=Gossypium raimondii TaxID=29730 RepID=A0A0D2TSY6_GOSRA|nr:uncharacterized protein LOC105770906 [Gossypium raimondii]KJB59974.1 hypothetical protein B456_009G283200 [Gossypium raimondii]MBA0596059.1 hypothetical protein [Gossypium raimondii]